MKKSKKEFCETLANIKSKSLEEFLEDMAINVFGRSRYGATCVTCNSPKIQPDDFRDDPSRKEFALSHMCQACQDSIYDSMENEID